MSKITKAVIPAAGFGTRFLPYTKAMPKEMLNIVDKPSLQYIVEEAVNSGITDILIITSRGKSIIEDHFDKAPELESILSEKNKIEELNSIKDLHKKANIFFIRQPEMLGLGNAIYMAKSFTKDEPFAILLGDDIVYNDDKPCLKQLIEMYEKFNSSILGVQEIEKKDTSKYGIVGGEKLTDDVYKVTEMIEKPTPNKAPSNQAILGRYILTSNIYKEIENTPKGAGGEIQLTDAIYRLLEKEPVYSYNFKGKRYDAGNKLGYLQATVEYALRDENLKTDFKKYLKSIIKD